MHISKFRDHNNNIMRADSDSGGEAIIICIDHTTPKKEYYDAQLEAVRSYAAYKFQSHPRTVVGLLKTSPAPLHKPFKFTRDLDKLFDSFQDMVRSSQFESFDIIGPLSNCLFMFSPYDIPEGVEKRIVMFAGGIVTIPLELTQEYADPLIKNGVGLDVVNFTLGDELDSRKKKLEAFVAAVNSDDKTHIIHVKEGSSLSNLLCSFMPDDAHVEANGMMNKDHQLIHSKKATENDNVDVKQPSSSFMAKGTKNKDQLIHLKTTSRLSSQKKATENENVSSKGAVGHEYVKNAPFKLRNGLKHSRSLGQDWLMKICLIVVALLAALLMCAA